MVLPPRFRSKEIKIGCPEAQGIGDALQLDQERDIKREITKSKISEKRNKTKNKYKKVL